MAHEMICDNCGRGMIRNLVKTTTRCYVCLRECRVKTGLFSDFDPTGESILHTDDDILLAMRCEATKSQQKDMAQAMNITPQYLSDVLKGRRAISSVIAQYYWLDRRTFFVPKFSKEAP